MGTGAPVSSGSGNEEVLARKAGECLKRGDFRRAMEGYKRLMKVDADAYAEAFVSACDGAFDDFLRQAQTKAAEIVIRNLVGVVPASRLEFLRVKQALAGRDDGEVVRAARALLEDAAARPEEARFAADALVAIPPEHRGAESNQEAALIDQALQEAAAGRYADATNALRGLARDSPFAPWRIFFKAVAAHAEGDSGTAGQALAKLDGACARMARAWIAPDSGALPTAVAMEGETKLAENLPAVLRVDGRADYASVFMRLCDYGRGFPAAGSSLDATLTDYLCTVLSPAALDDRSLSQLSKRAKNAGASPFAVFVIGRFFLDSVLAQPYVDERDARLIVNVVREVRDAFSGDADDAEAIVLTRYAAILLARAKYGGLSYAAHLAAEWLARARKARPTWETPALDLIAVYDQLGKTKECDAAVKAALARFPEHPDIVLRAGQVAFLRQRFDEALRHFRSVLARDPLSVPARREVINAGIACCGEALVRKDRAAAEKAAEIAVEHARDSLGGLQTPDKILLQCGNLFEIYLGAAAAKPYYDRAAERVAPDVFTFLRFATSQITGESSKRKRTRSRLPKTFFENARLADAVPMVEFLNGMGDSLGEREYIDCDDGIAAYVKAGVARDPDWRVLVIPLARCLLRLGRFYEVAEVLRKAAAKREPRDPVAVLLAAVPEPGRQHLKKLAAARAKLVTEGFTAAVAFCDEIRKRCEDARDDGPGGGGFRDFGEGMSFSEEEMEKTLQALFEMRRPKPRKKATAKKKTAKKTAKKKVAPAPPPSSDKPEPGGSQLDLPF